MLRGRAMDMNNQPPVDALVQAGLPRERIILAYAGEPVPESVRKDGELR